jgi:aromatic-L-amino-acid/L-tryptophan decarboxylase
MTPEEFRYTGHALVDWIAEYRAGIERFPVMSPVAPGAIRAQLPPAPPQRGGALDAALADLGGVILPGITHWNHPGFFAYFPSNTTLASVLADLAMAGMGAQCMSWQTSPAATELEEVVMDWLRQMVGLSAQFTGVIQEFASTATLVALLCARERSTGFSQTRGGLQAEEKPLVVYASEESHSSVWKAAMLAGFGKENLHLIETDENHALIPKKLETAMQDDDERGKRPCAVVATTGTTNSTALDPVADMTVLARLWGAWLHVDAALAGDAMILPECRWMWDGIEGVDSIVLNPHKWLGVGPDFSAYFVRDPQHLVRTMSTNPAYLRTAQDTEVKNFRDWGIPLGRRFRALKLWFLLREQGVAGLQARLRRDLQNAQWLKDAVDAAPEWERTAPVHLQTLCIRHVPAGAADGAALDAHNLRIAELINRGGRAYLTPSILKGKQIIRVSIGAEPTERRHVEALWAELQSAARSA